MRYLKLYKYFLRFSISKSMEFRFDFFFRIFMDLIFLLVNFLLFKVLYLHTETIGPWNQNQIIVFVATYIFSDAIFMTVLANNTWWFPFYINRGDLDYDLVRPVSTLFFLSLREFDLSSFINLIIGTIVLIYAFIQFEGNVGSVQFFFYFIFLFNGVFLLYLMRMLFIIPSFWTQSERGLSSVMDGMEVLGHRPHHIFKGILKRLITSIFPFALISSLPCQILFSQQVEWGLILRIFIVTIIFFFIMLFFWRFGLKSYSSASS